MARPKKPRIVDGVVLADNLYPTNRPNYYRYKRPDNTWKYFSATALEANRNADIANANRANYVPAVKKNDTPSRNLLSFWIEQFIAHREETTPKLLVKASWQNRRYHLKALGKSFSTVTVGQMTRPMLEKWWLDLTHHQQKARHAEFRKLFNWLMGKGICSQFDYNPFTTSDSHPRFYLSGAEDKSRMRLQLDEFWRIYDAAEYKYPALQIAMGISLTTFMRETDICTLLIDDNLRGELLKRVIGKSFEQRGSAKASRLSWNQTNYQLLRQLIARGLELALKNQGCPYIVSHMPKQRRKGKTKTHICQVTARRLIDMFTECRIAAEVHLEVPEDRTPATFHEIRSLSSKLATAAGHNLQQVQLAMAHGDEETTKIYLDEHDLPHEPVPIIFTKETLGRDFS